MRKGFLSFFPSSPNSRAELRQSPVLGHAGVWRLGHQPALDGIRALSVLAVLCFHAGLPWARGGFLGVDAFFVLSGFLITTLLLEEWRSTGNIKLAAFWAKRARRLLPALYVVLMAVVVYAVALDKDDLQTMRRDVVGVLTGLSYWWPLVFDRAYFQPFSHLWSLSMEQQWYFFWPFAVMGILWWRRGSLRALLLAILVMMLVSALGMIAWYHGEHTPTKIYLGTGPVQSLLAGAALALLLAQGWNWVDRALRSSALELAGLGSALGVIVVWGVMPLDHSLLFRSGYLWFAIFVAALIAAAMQPKSRILAPFLALAPLRRLGIISYGVYLWHVPLYWVLTEAVDLDGYSLFALGAPSAILIAAISYKFIETPIRKGAMPIWRKTPILLPAGGLAVVALLFLVTMGR